MERKKTKKTKPCISESPVIESDEVKFQKLLGELENLPDERARLVHLRITMIDYEAGFKDVAMLRVASTFDNNCYYSKLEREIKKCEIRLEHEESNQTQISPKDGLFEPDDLTREFTSRRQTFAILILLFGKPEVPAELNKTNVLEFIHFLTGKSKQNIRALLTDGNPTKHTGKNKSIQKLCEDLHYVRDMFGKLGNSEAVSTISKELDFIHDEFDQNQ